MRLAGAVDIRVENAWVRGEGNLIERALTNLLSNAIKYSPEQRTVQLKVTQGVGEFRVCVNDQGYGIPEQDLPRLFDRFQRVHRKETEAERGAGLGLAFVDAVVKRHGGRIEVHSEVGVGTTFTIHFPVE